MATPSLTRQGAHLSKPNLGLCPDCDELVSHQAESCPHCGRFIQRFQTYGTVYVDRQGWARTIAWGIWLAIIIPWLISLALFMILVAGGGLGAAWLAR